MPQPLKRPVLPPQPEFRSTCGGHADHDVHPLPDAEKGQPKCRRLNVALGEAPQGGGNAPGPRRCRRSIPCARAGIRTGRGSHVRVLVVGGALERRTGPGRRPTLPAAMPGAWPCTTGITLSPMSATRRPTRTRSRNRGLPEHAAALAEIPLPLPGANPGAAGLDNGSRTADARTSGCRADQLADRSPDDAESHPGASGSQSLAARPRVPVAGRGDPYNPAQVPSTASVGPGTTLPRAWAGERPQSRSAVDPDEGLARRPALLRDRCAVEGCGLAGAERALLGLSAGSGRICCARTGAAGEHAPACPPRFVGRPDGRHDRDVRPLHVRAPDPTGRPAAAGG